MTIICLICNAAKASLDSQAWILPIKICRFEPLLREVYIFC